MKKIFVDTDVALDLLAEREPHSKAAAGLFSLFEEGQAQGYLSALSFSHMSYILQKTDQRRQARSLLKTLKSLIHVLPVTDRVIDLALASRFKDFEDALQYYTALEGRIPVLVTRNVRDYSDAEITVCTAEEFLKSTLEG
ncbi:MAG TPA: PIN domain-containing protein [bacterium]|jgi:predicted nucleic acid-binding protein|nr:PIN domain-containing protein [bacterium]